MNIEGTHTFSATRDMVWPMFLDPTVLANVLPGCEKLELVDGNRYEGVLDIRVGPVQGKFDGILNLSDIHPPESYKIEVDGRGPTGFVKGKGNLRLEANGDSTTLHYDGEAQVGGRIASVGQRLLDSSAKAIIKQSLDGLEKQIEAKTSAETADVHMPPPPTPTQFTAGVAKSIAADLVPPEKQNELFMKFLLVLGVFLLWRFVSNLWMKRLARQIVQVLREKEVTIESF